MPDATPDDLALLLDLTATPTAAGREHRVIAKIEAWVAARPELALDRDASGNLLIAARDADDDALWITAHLDHPAFVVEERGPDGRWLCSFRGSVRDPYFAEARIRLHPEDAALPALPARVVSTEDAQPFRRCVVETDAPAAPLIPGCIGTWDLPAAQVIDGRLHTPACDDLAAVAAALDMLDALRGRGSAGRVRLLFTRAEEIGFVGATAACRHGAIPAGARIIALENSRSFADSPIGGGPIVRVGDRISTFDPALTAAVAAVAAGIAEEDAGFRFQRKLMAGGSCEATVFCCYGYAATCVCLPLGNYHNMAELDRVEREQPETATVGPEIIAIDDYRGLVRLLVGCAEGLGAAPTVRDRIDRLHDERAFVLA